MFLSISYDLRYDMNLQSVWKAFPGVTRVCVPGRPHELSKTGNCEPLQCIVPGRRAVARPRVVSRPPHHHGSGCREARGKSQLIALILAGVQWHQHTCCVCGCVVWAEQHVVQPSRWPPLPASPQTRSGDDRFPRVLLNLLTTVFT